MTLAQGRALVVTLGRSRGSLAAVRGLSAAGWTVGVGTPDPGRSMVSSSRHCSARHLVPRPRGDGRAFVQHVQRAIADGGYDVVFGGGDDWMAALATYRGELAATVAHPPDEVVARGLDKLRLADEAGRAGLASPRTVAGTAAALADWEGPVVVKCQAHWRPGQQHRHRVEARRFVDSGAAAERVDQLRQAGFPPVLQAPVEGTLMALIGLVHHGRLVGRVQQETSGLWPTPSGVSTRAVTVALDRALVHRTEALLQTLGWSGLVELQFLKDAGGVPHLIDLNARFYGSMALANAAGPNLAHAAACQSLGRPLPPLPDGEPGVRFLWAAGDLRRASRERRGGLIPDLGSTLRLLPGATTSVWDRRDPGPTRNLVLGRFRTRAGLAARGPASHELAGEPAHGDDQLVQLPAAQPT